uniref:C2 domain-containing protein n=1 Tax=Tetraselmis chuii TaxID=63592 RepID=A0A7S1T4F7_9CHLO
MAPITVVGKLMASLLMVIALVVIALPVSIIGTNFTLEWERFKEEQKAVMRAAKLPAKLKQAYPVLEMWMEDLNQHCYSLRKETAHMRKLNKKLKESLPENQVQLLEEVMKSAEAIKDLSNDDISTSTASIAKMLRRIQETQERLGALNKEAKSCLRQSVRAVQKSFSGALCRQTLVDGQAGNLKDLRRFKGFVLINVIGCKGLPVNNTLADIPDAYVIFASGVESCKTSVVNNSASPYFDETLILLIDDPSVLVSIDVFDKEMFSKDEFLGSYKLPLPRSSSPGAPRDPLATWKPHTFKLEGSAKDCGTLMMRYAFYELSALTEEQLTNPELWPKLMQLTTSIDVPSIVNKDVLSEVAALTQRAVDPSAEAGTGTVGGTTATGYYDGYHNEYRDSIETSTTEMIGSNLPSDAFNDTFRSSVESPQLTPHERYSRPLLGDTLPSSFQFRQNSLLNDTMGSQDSINIFEGAVSPARHGSLTVTLPPLPGGRFSGSMAPTPEGEVALPSTIRPFHVDEKTPLQTSFKTREDSSAPNQTQRSMSAADIRQGPDDIMVVPRFCSDPAARFSLTTGAESSDAESSGPPPPEYSS